jgi:hypothetical protein
MTSPDTSTDINRSSATPYAAFISYSSKDSAIAQKLHRALERYLVPRHLIGRATKTGTIPKRLRPVFRDREELAATTDIGAVLLAALIRSRALIVICSPNAAKSRWVDEEVRHYAANFGAERILRLSPMAIRDGPKAAFLRHY